VTQNTKQSRQAEFSKVSSLLEVLYTSSIDLTFENFHQSLLEQALAASGKQCVAVALHALCRRASLDSKALALMVGQQVQILKSQLAPRLLCINLGLADF